MQPESNPTYGMDNKVCNDSSAYLYGGLSAERKAAFEAHFADCPACMQFIGDIGSVLGEGLQSAPEDAGAEEAKRLFLVRHVQQSSSRRITARRSWILSVLIVACILLLLATSLITYQMTAVADARDKLTAEVASLQRALMKCAKPTSDYYVDEMVELHATAEDELARGMALMITDDGSERLLLEAEQLPEPGSRGAYHVWLQRDGSFVHAGMIPVSGGNGTFLYDGELGGDNRIAISLEPSPVAGSSPAGPVLLAGSFTA